MDRDTRSDGALPLDQLRAATLARPDNGLAWSLLGRALAESGDLDGAEGALTRALDLAPDRLAVRANLGAVALRKGDPARAEALLDGVLERDPDNADARYNRGLARLTLGHWAEGFSDYRARWAAWGLTPPHAGSPLWDGQALSSGPLLVFCEQGLGDAIHFIRYLPEARRRAGSLVLACRAEMGALLSGAAGIDGLIPLGAPSPAHGAVLPLMDLPGVLGLGAGDGTPVPYLLADADRVEAWDRRLRALAPDGLRVGVAWRGSPTHGLDRERSLEVAALAPLAAVEGVTLVALHPEIDGAEAAVAERLGILRPEPDADWREAAFLGTAGMMAALDLVITVDTAFAHLAGALGRPVRVLLPRMADWRWGLADASTPWYPTMTLCRQGSDGAWPPVIAAEARGLVRRAARHGKRGA
jgi:tetratricopeptide (TPR) repeat protein